MKTLLPPNIRSFLDRVATLSHLTWWITHPLRAIRTRGSNLDPIAALYREATRTIKAGPLSTFIEQGQFLGLSRQEVLQVAMAADNQLLDGVDRVTLVAIREYMIVKLLKHQPSL